MQKLNYLFLLLFISNIASATSKIKTNSQPVELVCKIRAEFIQPKIETIILNKTKSDPPVSLVYWNIKMKEISDSALCPSEASINLRLRSASASTNKDIPIAYSVEIVEPKMGEIFSAKVRLIKGHDTYLNRDYEEWTLIEQVND